MAVEKSYMRLGVFLVIAFVVVIATALLVIQRIRRPSVIAMVTYSEENVSGLDISSPVRYRGVPLGRVSDLQVDPRGRTIEIDFEVYRDRLIELGTSGGRVEALIESGVLARMRAQVVSNPVTGEAYLLLDFPENPPPPPELGFTPDRPYVPSMPTPLGVVRDRLPEVLERAEATLQTLRDIVQRIPGSLDRSDRFFTTVERIIQQSELPGFTADSRKFFATTSTQIEEMASSLEALGGEDGALTVFAGEARAAIKDADLPGSSQSTREAMARAGLAADDLRRSLPAIRETLEQLRALARQMQEQPESFVYGRRPPAGKPQQ
jgi:paraquat-inducible protein B